MLVQVCTKKLLFMSDAVSSFELAFFRSMFNLLLSSLYLIVTRGSLRDQIDSSNRHILAIRCLSGSVCFLCFVVAIEYLPLSVFFVIMNATPFFIAVMACIWLKEIISKLEVVTMIFAFGGILLVGMSKLGKDASAIEEQKELAAGDDVVSYETSGYLYNIGLSVAVGCVLGQSVTMVATRRLKVLSVITIQWYYAVTSCLVTGVAVALQ